MSYHVGDVVTIYGAWTDGDGVATDPADVFAKYSDPSGNITALEYGIDAELVRDSAGNYHVDIDANDDGKWWYRFYSTGSGQASSANGAFYVYANAI